CLYASSRTARYTPSLHDALPISKSILGMAQALEERHGGAVPATMEELVQLPGVGRKTANVVLGTAFGKNEGVVVDTHVQRLATRSEEHTSELQSLAYLVCRLLLE